jgi:hypothetical protein
MNERQRQQLRAIKPGAQVLSYVSMQQLATLRALAKRGLILLAYHSTRAWIVKVTKQGKVAQSQLDMPMVPPDSTVFDAP